MDRTDQQLNLFDVGDVPPEMPTTRYQGSKRKIADWISGCLKGLEFHTALDAFGGTGSVSWRLKRDGKAVTYNDILQFNQQAGIALIENKDVKLSSDVIEGVLIPDAENSYDDLIARTFKDVYFTEEENRFLDISVANIHRIESRTERALAWYALGQSAIAKRPYNLFHRKNLYMRLAEVERGFGNKKSWDRSFEDHFRHFAKLANGAVFDNGQDCKAVCGDAMEIEPGFDLVYIDPPYINSRGTGVDYHGFYHFLEGMLEYDSWEEQIDRKSRHLRLKPQDSPWVKPDKIGEAFSRLFERFEDSVLVVSYRSDGIPSIEELVERLGRVKASVNVERFGKHQYALSTNRKVEEVLIIAN